MRKAVTIGVLLLAASVAVAGEPVAAGGVAADGVYIAFTNSTNGMFRNCHCPTNPFGGLDRRGWVLGQVRERLAPAALLVLDSGDVFPAFDEPEGWPFLLAAYRRLGYDAIAIGDQEFLSGWRPWLEAVLADPAVRLPWLSTGYAPQEPGLRARFDFPPWRVFERGGRRVGVVAVTSAAIYRQEREVRLAGLDVRPAAERIAEFRAREPAVDLLIVLSHQGQERDEQLARDVSGIDVILGGHSQSLITESLVVNDTVICQAGRNGSFLGLLYVRPRTAGAEFANPPVPEATTAPVFTVLRTARWDMSRVLLPLLDDADDDPGVAEPVDAYYAALDERVRAKYAAARSGVVGPALVIAEPNAGCERPVGGEVDVTVELRNVGGTELVIKRVRSKADWLTVRGAPDAVPAGGTATVELHGQVGNQGRHLRGEYTIQNNDPERPVAHGAVNVRVTGQRPGLLDSAALVARWVGLVTPAAGGGGPVIGTGSAQGLEQGTPSTAAGGPPAAAVRPGPGVVPAGPGAEASPAAGAGEAATGRPAAAMVGGEARPAATAGAAPGAEPLPVPASPAGAVRVEYFHAAGCGECREVEEEVIPELRRRFGERVDLRRYDILASRAGLERLLSLMERLEVRTNEPVSVFVDERVALNGIEAIRQELWAAVEAVLAGTAAAAPAGPVRAAGTAGRGGAAETGDVVERWYSRFTVGMVVAAGLVDGLNPCAFATVVFLISFLVVAKVRGGRLLAVGAAFAAAVFVTYTLLGFGAFQVLRGLAAYRVAGEVLRWTMFGGLLVLAGLSARDAACFQRTGQAEAVWLQLPAGIKARIHALTRERLRSPHLLAGTVGLGVVVTLLESVCTGQVYLPALTVMARERPSSAGVWLLLVLYNLAFVVPLAVVIVLAYGGTRSLALAGWSKRNVGLGKWLMAALFVLLAAVLAVA